MSNEKRVEGFDVRQRSMFEGADGDELQLLLNAMPQDIKAPFLMKSAGVSLCRQVKKNSSLFAKVRPIEQTFIAGIVLGLEPKKKAKVSKHVSRVKAYNTYNEAWVLAYSNSTKVKDLRG